MAATDQERVLYRVPDLIRLTGLNEPVVRHLLATGVIPSRRLGRRVIVLPDELEQALHRLPRPGQEFENDREPAA
jgi:hypothetical protein